MSHKPPNSHTRPIVQPAVKKKYFTLLLNLESISSFLA
ncbi:hypothetical protein O53_3093 [Microcystis aeruginosa TAIHU98]|uniref:Uncharacterized protein n=2 Tax=Microcystis aeruginosa TaxID=1126 RepID=L7E7L3_MICAE|nr:hypothetical protein BH695_3584 [Microcystis aeruginosa PCC 7806SL]ELP54277.1 hypothetical protein O53_3093 [Microcystis aeruginosa TAIHU98]